MSDIPLPIFDPTEEFEEFKKDQQEVKIHFRIQKRNARKSITTVDGLGQLDLNTKKMLKELKNKLCCNGTIKKDENGLDILQFQGDQRHNVSSFLIKNGICRSRQIVMHGY